MDAKRAGTKARAKHIVLPTELVVRDSTAHPRRRADPATVSAPAQRAATQPATGDRRDAAVAGPGSCDARRSRASSAR